MLTQSGCSIPTALSCCAWEAALVPVLNPATAAINTANRFTTATTTALAAGTAGDSILIHNNGAANLAVTPIGDTVKPGEVVSYIFEAGSWRRG